MSEHYYISEHRELLAEGKAILTGDECQHLTRVMRRKTGDEVLLFDGSGREFVGVLETVDKDRAELTIKETRQIFNEPGIDLTMAVALPKGERQKWLIEKLTELGVRRYIPLAVERADIKFDANVHKRLQRQVIEASKQCGRLRLMEILPEMSRQEITQMFVNQGTRIVTDLEPGPIFSDSQLFPILAHPITDGQFGQWSFRMFTEYFQKTTIPTRMLVVIGPVGGFSDAEVRSAIDDGWKTLDLGTQVYRVETAAIVAAALILHLKD